MAELNATEAAARLGVKKATLYAYVSRGLLHRRVALDGRTSLFDSDELDELRTGRRRVADGEVGTLISTGVTDVADGSVTVAGLDLIALARSGVGFEAVAELLWAGAAASGGSATPAEPTGPARWRRDGEACALAVRVAAALGPDAAAIERLRVACAAVSTGDPLRSDLSPAGVAAAGRRLLPASIAALGAARPDADTVDTATATDTAAGSVAPAVADALWPCLSPLPATAERVRCLDTALVLLSDHGMATSTFGARIAASVRADPYAVVAAGLGVVGGALHGAASHEVHRLVVAAAEGDPAEVIGDARRRLGWFPGYGHSIHRTCDPRAGVLFDAIDAAWNDDPRLEVVAALRAIVAERTDAVENIDLALGTFTWLAAMDDRAGEAIFAIARTAGWLAHAIEEYAEAPLRFRPRPRYTGPRPR
ncbi:MAG: citrate/2-methylcitrate synthase [Acidimicrobiales bacterium]